MIKYKCVDMSWYSFESKFYKEYLYPITLLAACIIFELVEQKMRKKMHKKITVFWNLISKAVNQHYDARLCHFRWFLKILKIFFHATILQNPKRKC